MSSENIDMSNEMINLINAAKTQGRLRENIRVINILRGHMIRVQKAIQANQVVEYPDELLIKLFHEIKDDK